MSAIASQITSLTIVYSRVYSGSDQTKHQHRWIPRTKGQWRGKCFHLMTSSWSDVSKIGRLADEIFSSSDHPMRIIISDFKEALVVQATFVHNACFWKCYRTINLSFINHSCWLLLSNSLCTRIKNFVILPGEFAPLEANKMTTSCAASDQNVLKWHFHFSITGQRQRDAEKGQGLNQLLPSDAI